MKALIHNGTRLDGFDTHEAMRSQGLSSQAICLSHRVQSVTYV